MTFDEWWQQEPVSDFSGVQASHVEAAWNAAVLAEREACAKVCEELEMSEDMLKKNQDTTVGWEGGSFDCADAIRARSDKGEMR